MFFGPNISMLSSFRVLVSSFCSYILLAKELRQYIVKSASMCLKGLAFTSPPSLPSGKAAHLTIETSGVIEVKLLI